MSKFNLFIGRETVFGCKQSAISYKLRCNQANGLRLIAYNLQFSKSRLPLQNKLQFTLNVD